MQFYLEGYSEEHGIPEQVMSIYPHVKLVTDNFDDYGNQTLFRMYYKTSEKAIYRFMGKIKILHAKEYIARTEMPHNFTKLNKDFCSLGQSIDYYKKLRELDKPDMEFGRDILLSLNDIAINTDIRDKFPDKNGITNSLMRDSIAYHAYKMGHNVYYGMSSHIETKVAFTYTYDKEQNKKVYFEFNDETELPNRINVIVGKNGTGKTKMLSSLASVLSGRCKIDIESDIDIRPEFSRYIAISYSAFDNFEKTFAEGFTKRGIVQEKNYIISELERQREKCKSRAEKDKDFSALYQYFNEIILKIETFDEEEKFNKYFEDLSKGKELQESIMLENRLGSYVYCGLLHENRLISESEMYSNFKTNLADIIRMSRIKEWVVIMKNIFDGTNDLKRLFFNEKIDADGIIEENFRSLSSGQKIMLHIFTQVVVSITEDSLLLIDEPEIHLHPNAISSFMHMLNDLLDKYNSFAIISTHSPIVLQEIPAKYVRIFDNNEFYETKLWEECFGENISQIIANVFNVRPDESNYKTFFQQKKEEGFSKEDMEKLFENNLSMNAELYLNLLYGDED